MINVWNATDEELSKIKPGTIIFAREKDNTGVWCGIKKNGIKVVAWKDNIKRSDDPKEYVKILMDYAKG